MVHAYSSLNIVGLGKFSDGERELIIGAPGADFHTGKLYVCGNCNGIRYRLSQWKCIPVKFSDLVSPGNSKMWFTVFATSKLRLLTLSLQIIVLCR